MSKNSFFLLSAGSNYAATKEHKPSDGSVYRRFNFETHYIVKYCNVIFKDFKIPKIWGIQVDTIDDKNVGVKLEKPIEGVFPVFRIIMYYDYIGFFKQDSLGKINEIIYLLREASMIACKEMKWDTEPFVKRFDNLENLHGDFWITLVKSKTSKDRKHIATLAIKIFIDRRECYLRLVNKSDGHTRDLLVTSENNYHQSAIHNPNNFWLVNDGEWDSENIYHAFDNRKQVHYYIDISTGEVKTILTYEGSFENDFNREFEEATTLNEKDMQLLLKNWGTR